MPAQDITTESAQDISTEATVLITTEGSTMAANLTLAKTLILGGAPTTAVVNLVGMTAVGGVAEPLAGLPVATVTGANVPPVSVLVTAIADGCQVSITAQQPGSFIVSVQAPPYPDGGIVAPFTIAGTVANADDTVLVGTQVS